MPRNKFIEFTNETKSDGVRIEFDPQVDELHITVWVDNTTLVVQESIHLDDFDSRLGIDDPV